VCTVTTLRALFTPGEPYGRRQRPIVGACQTAGVGEGAVPLIDQYFEPAQVSAGLRQDIIGCWIAVTNAGGAAGFPFPPVDAGVVAPVADGLIACLGPDSSRLIVARVGGVLAGWVLLWRHADRVVAHWGTISHLQTLPAFRGQGAGVALMKSARQIARQEMGLEQLRLAARGGMGLERFYAKLGWREIGRWPGALRLAPGDDRDEILMILTPL
jgi:GNAT superfamily N-acetyltransferase